MKKVCIAFISKRLKADFDSLEQGKAEERTLWRSMDIALDSIKSDHCSGTKIEKRLWPKEYVKKYGINNLWKCNLTGGWRMTYTIKTDSSDIVCIILEWLPHKEYNRRFGY
jgi:hypothetical protein